MNMGENLLFGGESHMAIFIIFHTEALNILLFLLRAPHGHPQYPPSHKPSKAQCDSCLMFAKSAKDHSAKSTNGISLRNPKHCNNIYEFSYEYCSLYSLHIVSMPKEAHGRTTTVYTAQGNRESNTLHRDMMKIDEPCIYIYIYILNICIHLYTTL